MTTEEMIQENQGLQRKLDETAKALRSENYIKTFWKCLALVIILVCLYETKSKILWLPVIGSPQMCVVRSDWWGLKVQTVYPAWRTAADKAKGYSGKWYVMYPDHTWHVFYNNGAGSSAPTYAFPNYPTYF